MTQFWINTKEWLKANLKGDIVIWVIAISLMLISLPLVYSATGKLAFKHGGNYPESFLFKHFLVLATGFFLMWAVHNIPYTRFAQLSRLALWLSVPLLLSLLFFGERNNEATRAINIVGFEFQPADFARLALITNLALMLARRQRVKYEWPKLYNMLIWVAIICFLLALSGSTTSTIIVGGTTLLMFYIGRVPGRFLFIMALAIGIVGVAGIIITKRSATVKSRIDKHITLAQPETRQVLMAVANGSWTGKGMGKSHQRNYIDQAYSDYMYAIVVEEYGFVGGIVIMILYLVLLTRGVNNIKLTNRAFGGLLSAGLTLSIVLQAFIHICVSVAILPATGQPLPLLSKGGTSIWVTCIALGVILSVSRGEADESDI